MGHGETDSLDVMAAPHNATHLGEAGASSWNVQRCPVSLLLGLPEGELTVT